MTSYNSQGDRYTGHETAQRVNATFFALCKNNDTPVSLGMWLRWKYGEHNQLANAHIDPLGYHDSSFLSGTHGVWQFTNDYLVCEYLSKYKGLLTAINTEEVAIQSFKHSEVKCMQTNSRFKSELRGINTPSRCQPILYLAQRKIALILGDCEQVRIDDCGWGPGSTYSLKGDDATLVDKICEDRISVTLASLSLAQRVVGQDIHWLRARGIDADGPCTLLATEFQTVKGNRLTTVPKNAKTDRVIAMEPTANIFMQKAFGKHIRRRLIRHGIDLNQQSRNQGLAEKAYARDLATIDLKAASDTVSRGLVETLLPESWFSMLDAVRSPSFLHNGEWCTYQKFSSMGNGFTFELESAIFFALTYACCQYLDLDCSEVSIYGDDIVCPSAAVPLMEELLAFCGFEMNIKKSHYRSGFRESCGKHYLYGVDVSPIYQKEIPNDLAEVYRMANRIRRVALRNGGGSVSLPVYRNAWLASFYNVIPRHFVCVSSEEDTGLALSQEDFVYLGVPSPCLHTRQARYVFRARRVLASHSALLAYCLRFKPEVPFKGSVGLRSRGTYVNRKRRITAVPIDAPWCAS